MLYCLRLSECIYLVENKKVVEILKEVRNSPSVVGVSSHQLVPCFRPPKVYYTFTLFRNKNPEPGTPNGGNKLELYRKKAKVRTDCILLL